MTSPAGALGLGRSWARRRMVGRCTVFTDSVPSTDHGTGRTTFVDVDPHPDIPCWVRPVGVQASTSEAGGAEIIATGLVVAIPVDHTPVPAEKQRVRITAYPPDPGLVGMVLEIRQVAAGDVTARRLTCQIAD